MGDFRNAFYKRINLPQHALTRAPALSDVLDEKVIDLSLLVRVVDEFGVSDNARALVWKLALKVLPPYQDAWDKVQEHRNLQYKDLKIVADSLFPRQRAWRVEEAEDSSQKDNNNKELEKVKNTKEGQSVLVPPTQEERNSWILTIQAVRRAQVFVRRDSEGQSFVGKSTRTESKAKHGKSDVHSDYLLPSVFVSVFTDLLDTESDAFWCYSHFCERKWADSGVGRLASLPLSTVRPVFANADLSIPRQTFEAMLSVFNTVVETFDRKLNTRLQSCGKPMAEYFLHWFESGLKDVIPGESRSAMWDKVIVSGAVYICYVAASVVIHRSDVLLQMKVEDIKAYLESLKPRSEEIQTIFARALEMLRAERSRATSTTTAPVVLGSRSRSVVAGHT